jgi:hypothetical protein
MKSTSLAYAIVTAIGLIAAVSATPALAFPTETYVSANGLDTNSCDARGPCLTIARAISVTAPAGVVRCLDSSNFRQALTITQSISIDCSNAVSQVGPVTINGAGAIVHLVGLELSSLSDAIFVQSATALYVENCRVVGNNGDGISFFPAASAKLFITNSTFSENTGGPGIGGAIFIEPNGGATEVAISNTRVENNAFGIIANGSAGTVSGTVSNSVIAGNTANGITVSTPSNNVMLLIDQNQVMGNFHGLVAGGANGGMLVRNTSVTANSVGLFTVNNGTLFSYLNNSVDGNTSDGAFTGTVGLK